MKRTAALLALALTLGACDDVIVDPSEFLPGPGERVANPIVLSHGFFGFEAFAGIDFVSYYFEVRSTLIDHGEPLVFTPAVDPFNSSEVRGAQLLVAVEAILEETGAQQVNLIGHSQGGLDVRYVANQRPDLVASVTTIATPHLGTSLIDATLGLAEHPPIQAVLDGFTRLIGAPLYDAIGEETSVVAAMRALSTVGAADFNVAFPDVDGVAYYSIGGRTDFHPGGFDCEADDRPRFITRYDGVLDPVDPLLAIIESVVDGGFFGRIANDGLVTVRSSRWGRFLGCIPADHLDEVGQLIGDFPGLFNTFRHDEFYVDLVDWLREQGH